MRVLARTVVVMALLVGCAGDGDDAAATAADTLTRAQRDSVIGASRLPGAGGVRRALDVADSAAARQAARDSLFRN